MRLYTVEEAYYNMLEPSIMRPMQIKNRFHQLVWRKERAASSKQRAYKQISISTLCVYVCMWLLELNALAAYYYFISLEVSVNHFKAVKRSAVTTASLVLWKKKVCYLHLCFVDALNLYMYYHKSTYVSNVTIT